jgi:hypothetical protein
MIKKVIAAILIFCGLSLSILPAISALQDINNLDSIRISQFNIK